MTKNKPNKDIFMTILVKWINILVHLQDNFGFMLVCVVK